MPLPKLIEVMQIRNVKVYAHWSVLLIAAIILIGAVEEPLLTFVVLGSYYGVILVHECGHMVAGNVLSGPLSSIQSGPSPGLKNHIPDTITASSLGVAS